MKIAFVETEPSDQDFFASALVGHEVTFVRTLDEVATDAEIVSPFIHFTIGAPFLAAHPSLRLIAGRSAGRDHVDLAECARRGVRFADVHGCADNTVAEHTFALILALSRRLQEVREANKQPRFRYDTLRGFDLKDKTLGVIGGGRIGLRVIRIALAFGMRVLVCDPHRVSLMAEILGVRYVDQEELLRESHVVTLHVPLEAGTHHLIDRAALAMCRRGVVLINTARGGLIDTDALIEALDSGQVAGAGLDVLEEERVMQKEQSQIITDQIITRLRAVETTSVGPPAEPVEREQEWRTLFQSNRLLSRPDVVFTPHVAFNSYEAVERINERTVENIREFVAGRQTPAH